MRNFFKRTTPQIETVSTPAVTSVEQPSLGYDLEALLRRVLTRPEGVVRVITQALSLECQVALEWTGNHTDYDLHASALRHGGRDQFIERAAARGRFVNDVTDSVHQQADSACEAFVSARAQYATELADVLRQQANDLVGSMTIVCQTPVNAEDIPTGTVADTIEIQHTIITSTAVIVARATLPGLLTTDRSIASEPWLQTRAFTPGDVPLGDVHAQVFPLAGRTLTWQDNVLHGEGFEVFLPASEVHEIVTALPSTTPVMH